jgi:hypothetical protein
MFKRKLNEMIIYFSKFFLKIFVKLNLSYLSALILFVNLRRIKSINTEKIDKKIIILSKSGGIEDILSAHRVEDNNNKIGYYTLPRVLIKIIFYKFIKDERWRDYLTIDFNESIKSKKKDYKSFIKKTFSRLDSFWSFNAVLGFNPFYYAEHDLPEPIKDIGKKFLIIHKESVHSPAEHLINLKVYRDQNKKNFASKVAVYCEYEKKNLITAKVFEPDQIEVVGCARSDDCFKLRNERPLENKVIYFMIEPDRDERSEEAKLLPRELMVNWFDLANLTIKYLIEYANKHPDVDILFKGKGNVHSLEDLPKDLPKNCSFEVGNPGHKFLKDAKVAICFNSTIVFEAILANREVIFPNFGVDRSKLKTFLYNTPNRFVDTKEIFFETINKNLNKPYKIKKLSEKEKECVDQYLGNSDGKAGYRLKRFIEQNI